MTYARSVGFISIVFQPMITPLTCCEDTISPGGSHQRTGPQVTDETEWDEFGEGTWDEDAQGD